MLYMVEMELPDRSQLDEWHAWYESHIGRLLTVDGYHGAQRFEALAPCESPFLAIHDVDGPAVFESAAYRSVGGPKGTGIWRARMTNWHRNLFEGCIRMPAVAADELLALIAPDASAITSQALDVTWLDNAGLDGSIARRGVAIVKAGNDSGGLGTQDGIAWFRPISKKFG